MARKKGDRDKKKRNGYIRARSVDLANKIKMIGIGGLTLAGLGVAASNPEVRKSVKRYYRKTFSKKAPNNFKTQSNRKRVEARLKMFQEDANIIKSTTKQYNKRGGAQKVYQKTPMDFLNINNKRLRSKNNIKIRALLLRQGGLYF